VPLALVSDDGVVEPYDVVSATGRRSTAAGSVGAERGPPDVAAVSLSAAEPVDEGAAELSVERRRTA